MNHSSSLADGARMPHCPASEHYCLQPGQLFSRLQTAPTASEETPTPASRPSQVLLDEGALGSHRGVVEVGLAGDDDAASADELEVGRRPARVDLADQLARRVEDLHAVAHAGVEVTLGVGVET